MSTKMLQHSRRSRFFPGTPHPRRLGREDGFSLIELLVVILVIGILCAIAIPAFLSQQAKAQDASAKEMARTAETTAESISTEHSGNYQQVSAEALHEAEPSIRIAATSTAAYLSNATSTESSYSVTVKAVDGDELTITKNANGEIARSCASPVLKSGCSEGASGSW